MARLEHSESIFVGCSPEELFDMVADVTRMGEWSPICKGCWWDAESDPVRVGSWFTGRNVTPTRVWETRSQVVAADRGVEFAFVVGGSWVRWGYTFAAVPGGTELAESWQVLPGGVARFDELYGDEAAVQLAERAAAARAGIPRTLEAIKAAAENLGI